MEIPYLKKQSSMIIETTAHISSFSLKNLRALLKRIRRNNGNIRNHPSVIHF